MKNKSVMNIKSVVVSVALLSSAAHATSSDSIQQQIDDLRSGLHDVHMNTLQKYSESWGLQDRANIADLKASKVDKSVFAADQARQDKALADSVTKQAATDAKQTTDLKSYADKKATSAYRTSVAHTDAKVARADADRKAGDDALGARIDSSDSINVQQNERLETAYSNISANRESLKRTNQAVSQNSKQLANHEQRISGLEQQTSSKFASIDKRLDETDRHIDAGLSGVAAMASIPQVTEYQSFSVGAGVGGRGDQSAVAVGFSARATQNIVIKASVAGDSQQKWTVGAGASYGW